ncbi:hypothetical protein ACOSQ2_012342 [Xanthoceras sorbifolium]
MKKRVRRRLLTFDSKDIVGGMKREIIMSFIRMREQEMSSLVSLNGDTKLIQAICAVVLKGHWMKLSKPEIASSLTSTHIHQVFDQMRVHGLRPHLHACTVLLNSLVKDRLTDMQIR